MPDSLRLTMDVSMKYKAFRIGFRNLVGDFTIERTPNRRAWMMRFRRSRRGSSPGGGQADQGSVAPPVRGARGPNFR
jgi:hypothetical protein